MSNSPSPDIILSRRATVAEWPNKNPFAVGMMVAEVDTNDRAITHQEAQGLLAVAREILEAQDYKTMQTLISNSHRQFANGLKGVYQVVGTARTDGRPNCVVLPESLNGKIPSDLPLLPLITLPE